MKKVCQLKNCPYLCSVINNKGANGPAKLSKIMTIFQSLMQVAITIAGQTKKTATKVRKVGPYLAFYNEEGLVKALKFEEFEANFLDELSWPYANNAVFLPSAYGDNLIVDGETIYLLEAVERPEIIHPRPRTNPPEGYQEATLEGFWYCPYGRTGEFRLHKRRAFVKKDLQIEYRRD